MKALRAWLTYANVVSSLCLFLVLGGGAAVAAGTLAPNSVGSAQLKNNAVTTKKVKNGSITGAKIKISTLPTVPFAGNAAIAVSAETAVRAGTAKEATRAATADTATNAAHATSADTATSAKEATKAASANEATHATNADTAANALKVGGLIPSYFAPAGTYVRAAKVSAGGELLKGQGISQSNISRISGTAIYCVEGLSPAPTVAIAQIAFGTAVEAYAIAETEAGGCQAEIATYEKGGGSKTFPFNVILR